MEDQSIQFVLSSSVSTNQTVETLQPTSSQQNVGQSSSPSNCDLFEPPLKRRKMNTTSELEKAITQFVDEEWELQRNIERISPCNLSLLKRGDPSQDKPKAILFKFIPSSVWKILVDAINRNISSGSTVSSQLKSRNRVAALNDVIHFYAITMMIENTWGNNKRNLKKHFRDISEKYGSVTEMCLDRYLSLRSAFNPSIQEILDICGLLRQAFIGFVSGVQLVVIDEFVMAYQPRKEVKAATEIKGEPIPVVFIPRKPHPNG
jgi:hypothetical protein